MTETFVAWGNFAVNCYSMVKSLNKRFATFNNC